MQATIELPEPIFEALRERAMQQRSTVEAVILQAIAKGMAENGLPATKGQRVRLPLVHSANPGAMRSLTNSEIDDILG